MLIKILFGLHVHVCVLYMRVSGHIHHGVGVYVGEGHL